MIGVYGHSENVAVLTYFALYAVQHRGQESAGITVGDGRDLRTIKGMGLVSHVFGDVDLEELNGHVAIGHCRYSTTGSTNQSNIQPVMQPTDLGLITIGHNGNIVNALALRHTYAGNGESSDATTDTAVIGRLISEAPGATIAERVQHVLPRLQGSYCLTIATPSQLIAARDPMGNRPLSLGRINGTWMVSSETCALDAAGATFERSIRPG